MSGVEGITQEAAALHRFIDSIERFCGSQPGFATYLEASQEFLSHIKLLTGATKTYLQTYPSSVPADPSDYRVYRQELSTLRFAWHYVHRLVKPVSDAHTLHFPESLVDCLVRRLCSVPEFKVSRLAILHIRELNYLQVIAGDMRMKLSEIAGLVGSAPPFPPDLGLIGIPYSQARSVFINSLIVHEIGHFVFEKRGLKDKLAPKIKAAREEGFKPALGLLSIEENRRLPDVFTSWSEELFCDLFAVRFIGPCYCYAFIETFDLSSHLEVDGTINLKYAGLQLLFAYSHPSRFYRIQKQAEMLHRLGWWPLVESSSNAYKVFLKQCETLATSAFSFPFKTAPQKCFISTLDSILGEIIAAVEDSVGALDACATEYSKLSQKLTECFVNGIVPSSVRNPDSGKPVEAVTLLNVSYELYLERLHELIGRIEKQDSQSVRDCAFWTEKLEQWTLKALGDLALLSNKVGA